MSIGFAQKKWALEVKVGANILSNVTNIDSHSMFEESDRFLPVEYSPHSLSFKGKSGFLLGMLASYFLSSRFDTKSRFLYEQRSFKLNYKIAYRPLRIVGVGTFNADGAFIYDDIIESKQTFKINSLTIPFYGQYETKGMVKIFFYAEPYISIPYRYKV